MSQTYRHFFAPRRSDEFVGEILYHRRRRTETDFDLYRDVDTRALFVVGNEAHRPAASTTHTVYSVDEFVALAPGHRRRMDAALRATTR